jgi:16S rRNA C967 or C1407 C5-methylase (RsmB/RsmF family)
LLDLQPRLRRAGLENVDLCLTQADTVMGGRGGDAAIRVLASSAITDTATTAAATAAAAAAVPKRIKTRPKGRKPAASAVVATAATAATAICSMSVANDLQALLLQHCSSGLADAVLVDAPCSSLGTLRRGPGTRWELSSSCLEQYPPLQRELLLQGASLVRPGGVLVYATCTVHAAENTDVVQWFEQTVVGRQFQPDPMCNAWGEITAAAVFAGVAVDIATTAHTVQLLPHVHGTDGYYIARWRRRAD